MKKILERIIVSGLMLSLIPILNFSSMIWDLDKPNIEPKYILNQNSEKSILTDGTFDYYPLSGDYAGSYAVSLKETNKKTYKKDNTITIPETIKVNAAEDAIVASDGTTKEVVGIWRNGFHGSPAKTINLTNKIKVIDFEAFLYSKITAITIPYTIEKIGDAAFYACTKLASAHFTDSNKGGSGDAIKCSCPAAEENTQSDLPFTTTPKKVVEEGGVKWCSLKKIPSFCFFHCTALSELTLHSRLEEVEWEAFNGCSSLSSALNFRSIKKIRARAFQGCSKIPSVYIPGCLFSSQDSGGNLNGVIEPYAFNYCGNNITFKFNGAGTDENNTVLTWLNTGGNGEWGRHDDANSALKYTPTEITHVSEPGSDFDWSYSQSPAKMGGITIEEYTGPLPETHNFVNSFLMVPEEIGGQPVTMIKKGAFNKWKNKSDNNRSELRRLYLPKTLKAIDNGLFAGDFDRLIIVAERSDVCDDWEVLKGTGNAPENKNAKNLKRRIDLSKLTNLEFIGANAFSELGKRKDLTINDNGTTTPNTNVEGCANGITSIHLPYNLIAVGDEAFGNSANAPLNCLGTFRKCVEFKWDYVEPKGATETEEAVAGSRLQAIGNDAFCRFGWNDKTNYFKSNFKFETDDYSEIKPATLIFPATFRYFGILHPGDYPRTTPNVNTFNTDFGFLLDLERNKKRNRPAHTFAGCPLIKKVIFKKSTDYNLLLPLQSFSYCYSLQSLIFEDRPGKTITFHTQGAAWGQPSAGAIGCGAKSDFRGDPSLQMIVLPNATTNIRIQNLAFLGSHRAAIFLSGGWSDDGINAVNKIFGNKKSNANNATAAQWPNIIDAAPAVGSNDDVQMSDSNVSSWRVIGNESYLKGDNGYAGYMGYAFVPNDDGMGELYSTASAAPGRGAIRDTNNKDPLAYTVDSQYSDYVKEKYGTFSLNQQIPIHPNIHYTEDIKDEDNNIITTVEVGTKSDDRGELVIHEKCAYVCNKGTVEKGGVTYDGQATMAKYLYNLRDGRNDHKTAKVEDNITFDNKKYIVTKIGDSAFTAAFCDGEDGTSGDNPETEDVVEPFDDLETVEVPDSIEEIGDYAFLRAYGVKNFGVKNEDNGNVWYEMPSKLSLIGKNAFTFCNIKSFINIPYKCKFYENTNSDFTVCSTFSNNFSLRKITFIGNEAGTNKDSGQSYYYQTAQYQSLSSGTPTYTTSLYSKGTSDNKPNRLLLLLNRDADDKNADDTTESPIDCISIIENTEAKFDGTKGSPSPFLFGAYRMGYWIDHLTLGNATSSDDSTTASMIYAQPLISGVYDTTENKDAYVYLQNPVRDFVKNTANLKSIEGEVFKWPRYGLRGTEPEKISFSQNDSGVITEGLFSYDAGGTSVTYEVTYEGEGSPHIPEAGVLDLTHAGYKEIGPRAFQQNLAITKIIAPARSDFTIGANAFDGCAYLTCLDLSAISGGTVTLSKEAFRNSGIAEIIWPTSSDVTIQITDSNIFENCDSLEELVIPRKLKDKKIGNNCFLGCDGLTEVSADEGSDLVTIGDGAFPGCSSITSFDFSKLESLKTINTNAFLNAGDPTYGFEANFSASTEIFKSSSFNGSKVKKVTFSGNLVNLEANAFKECKKLTEVHFSNPNCTWSTINSGVFSNCSNLVELQLPANFSLETSNVSALNGSSKVHLYSYRKHLGADINLGAWASIGDTKAPIYYLIEDIDDLVSAGDLSLSEGVYSTNGTPSVKHWCLNGGHAECLGIVTGIEPSEAAGVQVWRVTFKDGDTTKTRDYPRV